MSNFSGYGAYMLFLALRTHFNNDKYDFFQMHGKLRATKESYNKRNDKWFFEKISKEHSDEELRDFYVANLLEDKHYITELIDDNATQIHTNYLRRRQSLSYHCADDMVRTFDKGFQEPFRVHSDSYPFLVLLFLRRTICIETMVILDDFINYTNKFNKHYGNDAIWPRISRKISKYRPFLKYDKVRMKNILKGIVNEQREAPKEIPTKEQTHRASV
jgi:hypothetical protein